MKGEEGNKKPLHPSTHHMLSSTTLLWAEDFVPKGNFIDWPLPCHQASSTPLLSLSRDRGSILRSTNEEYPEFYVPLSVIRKERPMWKFTLPLSPSCFWYWFDGLHRVLSWLINDYHDFLFLLDLLHYLPFSIAAISITIGIAA